MGDNDEPTALPETMVPEQSLAEERKMAKYSRSDEFLRLRNFMAARMEFYKHYLPDGSHVEGDPKNQNQLVHINVPSADMTSYWVAACIVLKEFQLVMDEYDAAHEAVGESEQ
jgi:hypothetical protein